MNHTIRIDFQTERGIVLAGELANPYRVVESPTSPVGLALAIDPAGDESTIDVLVFHGDEMVLHRVDMWRVIAAEEVIV